MTATLEPEEVARRLERLRPIAQSSAENIVGRIFEAIDLFTRAAARRYNRDDYQAKRVARM
ncbi:MAG: hypothetical protein LH472_12240 [Pyrinomonadaceae bacterium]|nr:hypothetical protein [Pyrinomonadaceae bacterium]